MRISNVLAVGAALALSSMAFCQEDSKGALLPGSAAPKIDVSKWVKGEPVDKFESGKIYVVEFWATWCPPCRESIPHLTELAKKFQNVTFVGVSVWENPGTDVAKFVADMGPKMDYHVALDNIPAAGDSQTGVMAKTWMQAAHQNGIPTAFVVDGSGKIAWIGHPMELEAPLGKIVAGTFDVDSSRKETAAATQEAEYREQFQLKAAKQLGDLQDALDAKDYGKALGLCDDLEKIDAQVRNQQAASGSVQAIRFRLLILAKSYDKAAELGTKLTDGALADSAGDLNEIAWSFVDPKANIPDRKGHIELAMKAAQKATDLTQSKDPAILDTLAWSFHWNGDKDKAVETEKKALALDMSEDTRKELEANLKTFQGA